MAHYTYEFIKAMAVGEDDNYAETVLTLERGDTAYCGASTKWDWAGPGTVTYAIYPTGWNESYEGVHRVPKVQEDTK
jgi:hypothetical protein